MTHEKTAGRVYRGPPRENLVRSAAARLLGKTTGRLNATGYEVVDQIGDELIVELKEKQNVDTKQNNRA